MKWPINLIDYSISKFQTDINSIFRLDEYALKISLKGCPLQNTVAFVDGSHVPGIFKTCLFKVFQYLPLQLPDQSRARGLGTVVTIAVTASKRIGFVLFIFVLLFPSL